MRCFVSSCILSLGVFGVGATCVAADSPESYTLLQPLEDTQLNTAVAEVLQQANSGKLEELEQTLTDALEFYGYYDSSVKVEKHQIEVEPGCQRTIRKSAISFSTPDPEILDEITQKSLLLADVPFSSELWKDEKDRVLQECIKRGYLRASFQQTSAKILPDSCQVDTRIQLTRGDQYYYGSFDLSGLSGIDKEYLREAFNINVGEVYHVEDIAKITTKLIRSGYFTSLSLQPGVPNDDHQFIPIIIDGVAEPQHTVRLGLGYGTTTGARGQARWKNPFVTDTGHQSEAGIKLSQVGAQIDASYIIPYKDFGTEVLETNALVKYEDYDGLVEETISLQFGWTKNTEKWSSKMYLEARHDVFSVYDNDGNGTYLVPTYEFSSIFSESRLRSNKGLRFHGIFQGASDALGSSHSFLRGQLETKIILPLPASTRFIGRTQFGAISTNSLKEIPPDFRFFAGGDTSVRGYKYKSLGPKYNGTVVGGKYLITASAEIEHFFTDSFSAAVFVDTGQAFDDQPDEFSTSVGSGVRFNGAFGQLRFDVANTLEENSYKFILSVGADF